MLVLKLQFWLICGKRDIKSFVSHDTVRGAISSIIPGLGQLKDIGVAKKEFHIANRLLHTPDFKTQSGKAQFVTHEKVSCLAFNEHSFTLTSVRSEGQFNSIIYEENDSYRNVDKRWSVMMNYQDMKDLGVTKHDFVNLNSEYGEMRRVEVYPYDLPRGNVMAYYPEVNVLIGLDRDSRSKTPAFKSVEVLINVD